MSLLITLLVFCIITGVLLYVARLVLSSVPIARPFANLIYALLILILLVVFLNEMGWVGSARGWRSWR